MLFFRKVGDKNTSRDEKLQNLIKVLKDGWKIKGVLMATVKEVYELLKKKQAAGEKIGMFAESLIEAFENDQETST